MLSIAIIGMGGAGLAFLHQLIQSENRDLEVIVVEPNLTSSHNKTWCYWAESDELNSVKHTFQWNSLSVHHRGDRVLRNLKSYTYRCVLGTDFSNQVMQEISASSNIRIIEDTALNIEWDNSSQKVHIRTGKSGVISCDYCFTSARGSVDVRSEPAFIQQFAGGRISFNKPVFSMNSLRLMDFDIPQHEKSVHFAYILPESEHSALVEITAFSPTQLSDEHFDKMFHNYLTSLAEEFNADYTLLEPENGIIPMDTNSYPRKLNERTFTLGTVSGMVKPSTGYAFYRMQAQAGHYVHQLLKGEEITPFEDTPSRFRFYDALLLNMLKHDPHATLPVFHKLFRDVPVDMVLDFLKESTSLPHEVRIFSRLPKIPFLKALWRHVLS